MMRVFENQLKPQTIIKPKVLFCTDLRTCGLIIGYIELLSGVLTFAIFGILFSFLKLTVGGCLLSGIYRKRPHLLVPFLFEHCFTVIGAVMSFLIFVFKPNDVESNADQTYTTDLTPEEDVFNAHKVLFTIGFIICIAISTHSWFVIFTLYQQYTFLQIASLPGPFAIAMQRSVALIENGYNPSYSRSKIGVQ